ncbi:hypothetical protein [Xylanimonas ulmi]|uniref:hypothetical protein n=1 Tax=Xylanimonas ulmi TaxID=228973 RepID=UPI00102C43B7|nr:hypothetical protein [Xylanibacterium ulmi]
MTARGLAMVDSLSCEVCDAPIGVGCAESAHLAWASREVSCDYCGAARGQTCDRCCPLWIVPAAVLRDAPLLRTHALDRLVALSESYMCRICLRVRCAEECNQRLHTAWCAQFTDCAVCGAVIGEMCATGCAMRELVASVAELVQEG